MGKAMQRNESLLQRMIRWTLILLISLVGCAQHNEGNSDGLTLWEKYGTEPFDFRMICIDYEQLNQKKAGEYSGVILFTREDCVHCQDTFKNLVQILNEYLDCQYKEILVLETDLMSQEDKDKMIETYSVSHVPTFMVMNHGTIEDLYIGVLSTDQIKSIMVKE